jgi:2-dehydrotetronate isomerase
MLRFATSINLMFNEVPLAERFAAAKKAGFDAVEVQYPYSISIEEMTSAIAAAGVEVVLMNTPQGDSAAGERGLGALPGREAEFEQAFAKTLDYAKAASCEMIHVTAGVPPQGADPEAIDALFIRNIKAALAASAGSGITLLLETLNHRDFPGYHLTKFTHARRLIEAVGDERLGFQLDLYHRQMNDGDLEHALRDYIDIARHIQIAGAPARNEPDTGEINYRHLFGVIEELGWTGWIGAEYRPRGDTVAGLGWMKSLLP